MKKKVLFVGEGIALSHIVRPMYLASCIDKDKYDIAFACSKRYKKFVCHKIDNYFEIFSLSPEEFNSRIEKPFKVFDKKTLIKYIDCEEKVFSTFKPDLVVGDMRVSLGISLRQANIPYINIANAYWSPFSTQKRQTPEIPLLSKVSLKNKERLFKIMLPLVTKRYIKGFNELRVNAGLHPVNSMEEMHCNGDLNLYLDVPSLAPTRPLSKEHMYIGPITEFVDNELPTWWNKIDSIKKPIIYFSLGSTGNLALLGEIVNALNKLDVTVIMATANRISNEILSEKFFVSDYIPALLAIEKSDIVICNGGSGSIYQALSKGKPLIGFPTNMDQCLAMNMVEKKGLGKAIRPNMAKDRKSVV